MLISENIFMKFINMEQKSNFNRQSYKYWSQLNHQS